MHGMAARKQAGDDGAKRGPGRRPRHAKGAIKSTSLYLRPNALLALDEAVVAAKRRGLAGALSGELNKSALVRGILAAVLESGLDFSRCGSEDEAQALVAEALRRRR